MMRSPRKKADTGLNAVPGNDRIKKILRLALEKGRVPNSLIFSGPGGVGKLRLAVLLAQAVNCERGTVEPCRDCPACRKIAEGKFPDVLVVKTDGRSISIDQMQEVRQAAYVRPLQARRRIFIIPDAEKMTPDAANCMLKILEEPPSYSHLILVTSMLHLILPTIKSRCQVLNFAPIGREEITKALVEKGLPEERAGVIALLVKGNLEAAMELDWDKVSESRREAWDLFAALQGRGDASALPEELRIRQAGRGARRFRERRGPPGHLLPGRQPPEIGGRSFPPPQPRLCRIPREPGDRLGAG